MKSIIWALAPLFFMSCSTGQKLFVKRGSDNSKITGTKGFFSGIDYVHIEKKIGRKLVYSIIYNCECKSPKKIDLHKSITMENNKQTSWLSVTDTIGQPRLFEEIIDSNRVLIPYEFMAITKEEVVALEEALGKVDKSCCKLPEKPINKIIGYIKLR